MKAIINKLLETFITGDFIAGKIRHVLSFLSGFLVAKGLTDIDTAAQLTDVLTKIVASPELWGALISFGAADRASVANKKNKAMENAVS